MMKKILISYKTSTGRDRKDLPVLAKGLLNCMDEPTFYNMIKTAETVFFRRTDILLKSNERKTFMKQKTKGKFSYRISVDL